MLFSWFVIIPIFFVCGVIADHWQANVPAVSLPCVFIFFVFLNSSLNPLVYFCRYREIREV